MEVKETPALEETADTHCNSVVEKYVMRLCVLRIRRRKAVSNEYVRVSLFVFVRVNVRGIAHGRSLYL